MDKDMPADWAIDKACQLCDCMSCKRDVIRKHETHWAEGAVMQLARYIEAHEQPPVDPDLETAREICAKVAKEMADNGLLDAALDMADEYLRGEYDSDPEVRNAIAKLKEARGK